MASHLQVSPEAHSCGSLIPSTYDLQVLLGVLLVPGAAAMAGTHFNRGLGLQHGCSQHCFDPVSFFHQIVLFSFCFPTDVSVSSVPKLQVQCVRPEDTSW